MRPLADYHIHTHFSCDSGAEMAQVCEAAIAGGLDEIAFTDHLDFGPADPPHYFQPAEYIAEVERCRARYGDRLTVRLGIEIGEPHLFAAEARSILALGAFDFVLGSAHYDVHMRAAWKQEYFDQPLEQACAAYFQQVVRVAEEGDFDVLSHVDLVKRDARKFGLPYDGPGPYAELIQRALRAVVKRGKGIEINTSPLHRGQAEPCPDLEVLRWYRELGGEILTLGSDAHQPEAVAAHFDVALEMARAAGFTRLARFERRQVRWEEI